MKTTTLTPNIVKSIQIPKRNDERVILHFDYDCFYASVFENENPSLKSQPLGIKQKSILATCNYVARARGVKKLMLISEAQRLCPDLILMNGEDLTRFRDASKKLWAFLRAHSWNARVERLGLDEVFLDVTDVVAYNAELLNAHALGTSFFQLDRNDPVKGFAFDGARFYGCLQPEAKRAAHAGAGAGSENENENGVIDLENPLCVRLMLASHLAGYLRHKLDEDFGYTSSGGVSTNKLLAKLAGNINKPNNQTTLLVTDGAVEAFMDAHNIRKVPGIGSRIAQLIEEYMLSRPAVQRDREGSNNITVGDVRRYPGMSPGLLEQILDRPGAERGSGEKVWNLLHGVDPSEVKEASDVPTQISIEDTYMARPLQTPAEVHRELHALATSLIRRMRVDLMEPEDVYPAAAAAAATAQNGTATTTTMGSTPRRRWLAYPKTIRLSTRGGPKRTGVPAAVGSSTSSSGVEVPNFSRSSRSAPLPSFVFQYTSSSTSSSSSSIPHAPPSTSLSTSPPIPIPCTTISCEDLASRLVTESLLPLFRRLHPSRSGGGLNLALLNICVTNMVLVARDESGSGSGSSVAAPGRDIGRMFRTQEDKLREWTVYDPSPSPAPSPAPSPIPTPTPNIVAGVAGIGGDGPILKQEEKRGKELVIAENDNDDNDEEMEEDDVRSQRQLDAVDNSGSPLVNEGSDVAANGINDDDGDDGTVDNDNDNDIWEEEEEGQEEEQEESNSHRCHVCGHAIPAFAMSAHERYHTMDE
ncbi:DNA/RNA polymerase [Xylaria sp. FL1042]|nr:DNA/RNA polymerase [Xylaria sp. FL1042]